MEVNKVEYEVKKLLGHGKGGYSYLVVKGKEKYVLKQIHHEPCPYYNFGNKIEAEKNDYQILLDAKIRVPKMIDIDLHFERILKEYIEGETIFELVKNDVSIKPYMEQIYKMSEQAKSVGINIDYFPTNFVLQNGLIYYIDYECNDYMDEWNFENWGINYWSKTTQFIEYLQQHMS